MKSTVAVIGAGIIGVSAASFLLRRGQDVLLIEQGNPGEGTSFGNAGCFNGSSIVPMSMPGTLRKLPKRFADPLGPLGMRLGYLPRVAPSLLPFIAAGPRPKVARQARALRSLLHQGIETLAPLVRDAGAQHLVERVGHLYVYRSPSSFAGGMSAWQLRR